MPYTGILVVQDIFCCEIYMMGNFGLSFFCPTIEFTPFKMAIISSNRLLLAAFKPEAIESIRFTEGLDIESIASACLLEALTIKELVLRPICPAARSINALSFGEILTSIDSDFLVFMLFISI